jgi:hypothetical protein
MSDRDLTDRASWLLRHNFRREYEDGEVGLVMPAATAVGGDGKELSRIVLSFDHRDNRPCDADIACLAERALGANASYAVESMAYAVLRIDCDVPRVLSWCRDRTVVSVATPCFEGLLLTGWQETSPLTFSNQRSPVNRDGLIEIGRVSGQRLFGLLVGDRLRGLGKL